MPVGDVAQIKYRTRRDPDLFELNDNWSITKGDRTYDSKEGVEYDNFDCNSNDEATYVVVTLKDSDFEAYYKDLPQSAIREAWQIEKIFSNYQLHTYDICLVALFLGIPVSDLVKITLPERSQSEKFDEQILTLHAQGLNYRQISNQMGASYDYCKLVAYRHQRTAR
jgi:hypothetical protein